MKHRGLCSEQSHSRAKSERAALRTCARQRGSKSSRMRRSLLKVFSPAPSSRFPLGKHECINSLHHQVHGGSKSQRLKSTCFWQSNLCRCANHLSLAPRPGSWRYYCWRRQNKSPRALLEKGGNKNSFNSLGREKKKLLKINSRIQSVTRLPPFSAPAPPLAFPSKMCTNTSCGQGFSSAAREIKQIPAGLGREQRPVRGSAGSGQDQGGLENAAAAAHPALRCEGTRDPATVPRQHRAARGDSRWLGGLGTISNHRSFRWAMGKSNAHLNPAWHACASDRREI